MATRAPLAALLLAVPTSLWAQEPAPLSAIDWLNQTPTVTLQLEEPPVSAGVETPTISVDTLDDPGRNAVGLLPPHMTGLPQTLWQNSQSDRLGALIAGARPELVPATQALLYTLLLAEANPTTDPAGPDAMLLTRIDKLMEMGALDQAEALIDRAGPDTPALFERWLDITLLLGREDRACARLAKSPHLAPNYATRVFCTARAGEWSAAVLTLGTANALGLLTAEEDALLARFLDPDLFEGDPLDVATGTITPLTFRLYEAIGEARPTTGLPRPFAHADLRETAGWKARLDAAERLARTGALPANRLLGIYSEGKPSASGMIWDRVAAVQAFDRAIEAQDANAVADTLPSAWSAMQSVHLEVPFARLYGERLLRLKLTGVSARLARDVALLSPAYELAAKSGPRDFLAGLAMGSPPRTPTNPLHRAIADAFHDAGVPQDISTMLVRGQLGEVILRAMDQMEAGASGDLAALTNALAIFRAVGLEDTARRASLQAALLDFRG
ncbi:hypothetical protein NBRC116590_27990 [Pelagimonas sp. KU-00592-HH]|uniref:hypothetical protein n=1 Tax=Pelagimonas sp. KU-00592-HH TaxID=3127651 RepID=UPI003108690F